ncbi:Hypothetical predicted protein, partial [Olea europaea subsp. europaea]
AWALHKSVVVVVHRRWNNYNGRLGDGGFVRCCNEEEIRAFVLVRSACGGFHVIVVVVMRCCDGEMSIMVVNLLGVGFWSGFGVVGGF